MARRLIINADDFGLTRGVNRAIAELHDAGAVRSATLMASGAAFEDAACLARERPTLGVGCHIVLTDGNPVSPPRTITTLLAPNGRTFRSNLLGFVAAIAAHQIDPTDIEREAVAQIRRLQQAGLTVTHIDAHKHTHVLPFVLKPLLRAAARTGVRAIRNPFEQPWAFRLSSGTLARTSQIKLIQPLERAFLRQPAIHSGQIRTSDGTVGVSATGNLDETTLRNLVAALPDGTWELVCHPGYNDADLQAIPTRLRETRDTEREALLAVFAHHSPQDLPGEPHPELPEVIHYGSLASESPAQRPHTSGQAA